MSLAVRGRLACALLAFAFVFTPSTSTQERATGGRHEGRDELVELYELGSPSEFVEHVRPLLATGGPLAKDGEILGLFARALHATGARDEAFRVLDEAPLDAQPYARIELARARLFLAEDRLQEAFERVAVRADTTLNVRHPRDPESLLLLVRILARQNRFADAEAACATFLERAPLHPEAPAVWHIWAQAAVRRGAADLAQERFSEAQRQRRWQEIVRVRRLQIRLDPDADLPRLGLALAWLEVERFERAEVLLEALVQRSPTFCRGWRHLAACRRMRGDFEGAEQAAAQARSCDPSDPGALYEAILAAHAAGHADVALERARELAGRTDLPVDLRSVWLVIEELERARGNEAAAQAARDRFEKE